MRKNKQYIAVITALLISTITACGQAKPTGIVQNEPSTNKTETKTESQINSQEDTQIDTPDYLNTVSMEEFLLRAKEPLGKTLYVWGGGWNEADNGAGEEAVTIGVSPKWEEFFNKNDSSYDYNETRYQIHDGLDCSGYLGWVIYNTFENENGKAGYVMGSTDMASTFAAKGWGDFTSAESVSDWKAGDVMSMSGHVWIALGTCDDQSVLLMHSSPPGVRLCGTLNSDGTESKAVELARKYTKAYYPKWDERYPTYGVNRNYLYKSSQMRWNGETFSDATRFQAMTPEEILAWMFD